MSLKKTMEDLLKEVHDAHTKVDGSVRKQNDRTSAYHLFSSWPHDIQFQPIYDFCLEPGHTSDVLLEKYALVLGIISNMLQIANSNYTWATNVGHITGEDGTEANGILVAISAHLNTAKNLLYDETSLAAFTSVRHLALPHALAQLKALSALSALSAPCDACGGCERCGAKCGTCGKDTIKKKPHAGHRCRACAERATARTAA